MKTYTIMVMLCLISFLVSGMDPPKVHFQFRLEEDLYRLAYSDHIQTLEKEVETRLRPVMNHYLSFISFESNQNLKDTFTIILDNKLRTDQIDSYQDVVFHFELRGIHVKEHRPLEPWLYLDKSSYGDHQGDLNSFVDKIVATFTNTLKYDYPALVEKLFSHLVLTDKAHFVRAEKKWALPFHSDQLRLGKESLFEISTESPSSLGICTNTYLAETTELKIKQSADVPAEYIGCIAVKHSDGEDLCGIFNSSVQVHAKEVTLKLYKRQSQIEEDNPVSYQPISN